MRSAVNMAAIALTPALLLERFKEARRTQKLNLGCARTRRFMHAQRCLGTEAVLDKARCLTTLLRCASIWRCARRYAALLALPEGFVDLVRAHCPDVQELDLSRRATLPSLRNA